MPHSRSASPKRTEKPSLLLFLDGETQTEMRHLLLAPGDYTDAEREMFFLWKDSDNIFNDWVIEEEEYLFHPDDLEPSDKRPTTMEEAKPHIALWMKLEKMKEVTSGTVSTGPCLYLHISIFN